MSDSDERSGLAAKHQRNRERRSAAVKRLIEHIQTHDADVWGDRQNCLVDSQLDSASESDIDVELRRRVERPGAITAVARRYGTRS